MKGKKTLAIIIINLILVFCTIILFIKITTINKDIADLKEKIYIKNDIINELVNKYSELEIQFKFDNE